MRVTVREEVRPKRATKEDGCNEVASQEEMRVNKVMLGVTNDNGKLIPRC